ISVSHSSLTLSAAKSRLTRSSCTGGPGRFPFLPRFFPNTDDHWLSRQIRHAVCSRITSPAAAASPARERYPNSRSSRQASSWGSPGATRSARTRWPAVSASGSQAGGRASGPARTPRRGSRRRRARSRAGRAVSRQVRLRQVGRRTAADLVLLPQQPIQATLISQLGGLFSGLARPGTVLDIGLTHPVRQARLGDPEVVRDRGELLARFAVPRDADDVVTELLGIGSGHGPRPSLQHSPAPQIM